MSIPTLQVYTALRQSPDPLNFAGLMAVLHRMVNTQDSLTMWSKLEAENVRRALEELTTEGKITVKFQETLVYEVT